jgi:endonuclease IV
LIAHTRDDVKKIMDQCGVGFCLDLAHASKAGLALKKDYKAVVRQFFALGPRVAHISDGCLDNGIDEHLDLGKGELDLNFFVSMIVNSDIEYLTFEVPKRDGLKNDIKNVAYWGSLKS